MKKIDIARELCAKFPKAAHAVLARKLYEQNKSVFLSVEQARKSILHARGKNGERERRKASDKSAFEKQDRHTNPYSLPKSEQTKRLPFFLKGHRKILVIADVHIPYHSNEAISVAIKEAKKEKVDAVLIDGDLLDFYQLSRFDKDPRKRSFAGELEAAKQFFAVLNKQLKCKIYYKLGNHELRYEKYMQVKAPELLDVAEFSLEHILHLKKYNVTLIDDKTIVRLNKLNVVHGHEFGHSFFSPVNVARGLYLRSKVSALQAHQHQTAEHTEKNMNNEIVTTWGIGCLCELNPAYLPINKWNWGFAFVHLDPNGKSFKVINKRISTNLELY